MTRNLPKVLAPLSGVLLLCSWLLGGCVLSHGSVSGPRRLAVVGQPSAGAEVPLFFRVEVDDRSGWFNGFVKLLVEGPLEAPNPDLVELGAGSDDPASVARSIELPPERLAEVVAARVRPGTYRIVALLVGNRSKRSETNLEVVVTRVPLAWEIVVPVGELVYLGVFRVLLSPAGEALRAEVNQTESAEDMLADLHLFQQSQAAYLAPFLPAGGQAKVFAARVKEIPRAAVPSTKPACTAQNVGECALLCKQGDGRCCTDLGFLYESGSGVPKDLARTSELYARGCELGNGLGCKNLGVLYEFGRGVAKEPTRAFALYRRSCDMGEPRGCHALGNAYSNGTGVPADSRRAQTLYASACQAKIAGACNNEGWLWFNGKAGAKDLARGARLFQRACDLGDANGCSSLGWALAVGSGLEKDRARGLALLQRGCKGGNSWGCSKQQALCDQMDGQACAGLAAQYARGEGVAKDEAKARSLQLRACELGHRPACPQAALVAAKEKSAALPSAPSETDRSAAKADPWGAACRAQAAYQNVRWTVSVTEKVAEGRVTSRGKRVMAVRRGSLTRLVEQVHPGDERALAAQQKRLLDAIVKAPRYDNPVPAHLGGGADMIVSDALKKQLARFWTAVVKAAAEHKAACTSR